ncbi:3383_t:CDS:1, partial [Gigaspora rosea]
HLGSIASYSPNLHAGCYVDPFNSVLVFVFFLLRRSVEIYSKSFET